MARLPMTPEEVAAAYGAAETAEHAAATGESLVVYSRPRVATLWLPLAPSLLRRSTEDDGKRSSLL
jgi:hypothetical protein